MDPKQSRGHHIPKLSSRKGSGLGVKRGQQTLNSLGMSSLAHSRCKTALERKWGLITPSLLGKKQVLSIHIFKTSQHKNNKLYLTSSQLGGYLFLLAPQQLLKSK